ncbi:MAG: hypothetical protein KF729_08865 [Sandaracinaceae bacterium]|nr:hypothetical protein [Sandaracinaceae bacterium]
MRSFIGWAACASIAASACSAPPTQVLVVVSSDLAVPAELDEIAVTITHPDGAATRTAGAALGPGEVPLPRTLAMLHEGGPLGPYRLRVEGRRGGAAVLARVGELSFVAGQIRVWRVALDRACLGVDCEARTCAGGACRDLAVGEGELEPYEPAVPRDAGFDAAPPADGGEDAGGDAGIDAGPECDDVACEGGVTCACEGGACCAMGCSPVDCRPRCAGEGTACVVDASASSGATVRCEAGAACTIDAGTSSALSVDCSGSGTRCEVDCTNSTGCSVRCASGAACLVRCTGATGCAFRPCTGSSTVCGGGVEVCGRDCL